MMITEVGLAPDLIRLDDVERDQHDNAGTNGERDIVKVQRSESEQSFANGHSSVSVMIPATAVRINASAGFGRPNAVIKEALKDRFTKIKPTIVSTREKNAKALTSSSGMPRWNATTKMMPTSPDSRAGAPASARAGLEHDAQRTPAVRPRQLVEPFRLQPELCLGFAQANQPR
jgi:hypothetical protein